MSASNLNRRTFLQSASALPLLAAGGAGLDIFAPRSRASEPFDSANPKIREARELSVSLLKPSARDLSKGFALHAEALVVDAYGFAPRAAVDGLKFTQAVESGATEAELSDLREEMSMTRWATDAVERAEFLEAMRCAGVTCVFQNAGEEGSDPLRLMKRLARFTYATDLAREDCAKAVIPKEVEEAKKRGTHCLLFSGNGVPLRQEWESTRDELRLIRIFHQLGIRMMHLTYNRRNPIGDGAGEPGNAGLSDFGHAAVAELNRCGVIVDVAHSGWRTSMEAARASQKPMVASHSACAGLYSHYRAKPDDVFKAICDTGGYLGVCLIPRFLGGDGDIVSFLDQIDYAVKKFGAEHVAIGTDVAHVSRNEEAERSKIPKRTTPNPKLTLGSERWEHLWPADNFVPKPHAERSLAWTNWPLFTVGMVQRGHSEEDIRKILALNVMRVLAANQLH
jgi:membrane dipeptidase